MKQSKLTVTVCCEVADGSLVHKPLPFLGEEDHLWVEEESRETAGNFFQSIYKATLPCDHWLVKKLPDNCWVTET